MQFDGAERGGEGGADGTRAAAQVHHDGRVGDVGERLLDEELGTATGYEDPGFHGDAQSPELGPAQDEFEGLTQDTAVDHGGQFVRGAGGGEDQPCLVLGEHTAAWRAARPRRSHGTRARTAVKTARKARRTKTEKVEA